MTKQIDEKLSAFVDGELDYNTVATNHDSDSDGLWDGVEIAGGANPNDDTSWPRIADGDVNGDGQVNAGDYLLAMRIALGVIAKEPVHLAHGDLYPPTPDDDITVPDLLLILKLVLP